MVTPEVLRFFSSHLKMLFEIDLMMPNLQDELWKMTEQFESDDVLRFTARLVAEGAER